MTEAAPPVRGDAMKRWLGRGRAVFVLLSGLLPWGARRRLLELTCGYTLAPSGRIGLAWIDAARLTLGDGARIGALSVFRRLELLEVGDHSATGALNWVTSDGAALNRQRHENGDRAGRATLVLGRHATLTSRHHLDCTERVELGDFASVGGWRSVFLTRGVDLDSGEDFAAPITVGRYCLVGTSCVVLPGANLPDYCVLGARSVLKAGLTETHRVCAGSPARPLRPVAPTGYFTRDDRWVE